MAAAASVHRVVILGAVVVVVANVLGVDAMFDVGVEVVAAVICLTCGGADAAVAAGCDGIFMEVHDNPNSSKSDASTQWPLDKFEHLLEKLIRVNQVVFE